MTLFGCCSYSRVRAWLVLLLAFFGVCEQVGYRQGEDSHCLIESEMWVA